MADPTSQKPVQGVSKPLARNQAPGRVESSAPPTKDSFDPKNPFGERDPGYTDSVHMSKLLETFARMGGQRV